MLEDLVSVFALLGFMMMMFENLITFFSSSLLPASVCLLSMMVYLRCPVFFFSSSLSFWLPISVAFDCLLRLCMLLYVAFVDSEMMIFAFVGYPMMNSLSSEGFVC